MSVRITYIGHSAVLLQDGKHSVAIDPFLTGNPVAKIKAADVKPTHIVLSHGHEDHFGDALSLAKAHGSKVYGAYELVSRFGAAGHEAIEPMNPGGRVDAPFGFVALTQAFHSSSYEGGYTGMPCGVIVHIAGKTIYHTGDTCLFSDMKLIGEIYKPDIAFICAGDRFTMGPQLAARAAEFIAAPIAVPIHWGTWPLLADEAKVRGGFTPKGVQVRILKPSETLEM